MATVIRLRRCKIVVYPGDHPPPHFHVLGPDFAVAVAIEGLEVIAGSARPQDLTEALAFAQDNLAALGAEWNRLNPPRR